jgi:peptidoglycan/xylan/chitin deacetylase (PgdA/CDA1 family)
MLGTAISSIISALVRWSGLATMIRFTIARNRVSILVYHDPAPDVFERHLRFLVKRYNVIALNELVARLGTKEWDELPPRALVITFDDGHRGNAKLLALFRRYGVRPTIYVCSQIVGTKRHYWFLESKNPEPLKGLPNGERLAVLQGAGFSVTKEYPQAQALSVQEMGRLSEAVDFGAHTRFHPVLTTCTEAECATEIESAKTEIEAVTGASCADFSFPNGDYGGLEVALVRHARYRSARTIDLGWNNKRTDPFRLKVLGTEDDASINRLAADLTGITGYLARATVGSLNGRHRQVAKRASRRGS